jgi:hypothetical protein
MIKLFALIPLIPLGSSSIVTCSSSYPSACDSEQSCAGVAGVWVPVANATYIPPTALSGGRRYTLSESDSEFTYTISAPNGGYCTFPLPPVNSNCESNVTLCGSMGDCFYRDSGAGRWFEADNTGQCITNCSSPLVFCDESRCGSTFGCSWFVKTQSTANQCYCIDNPGIFGNPPPPESLSWMFWDQPASLPVFIFAVIAIIALGYNIYIHNLRPLWRKKI